MAHSDGVAVIQLITLQLVVLFTLLQVNQIDCTGLVLQILHQGWFLQQFFILIFIFRGRKGAECFSISLCCQLPVPEGRADAGILPIDLRNVTTFGLWLTEQVVLYWHQKKSKLPIYAEAPHEPPLMAFEFLVNMAIATRPFMHPTYYEGLP